MKNRTQGDRGARTWLLLGVLAVTALAGCLSADNDGSQDPAAPTATLQVDRSERWAGEPFTLDARNSSAAPDQRIVAWTLKLGDGNTLEGDNISEAYVQHVYDHGGAYEVRLDVVSEDEEGTNRTAETMQTVAVHDRHAIPEQTYAATPLNDTTGHGRHTFAMHENATLWEADVHLEGASVLEETEIVVRVVDDENRTLDEENATLDPEENWTLRLDGEFGAPGDHHLEIRVLSGSAHVDGEIRVYHNATA